MLAAFNITLRRDSNCARKIWMPLTVTCLKLYSPNANIYTGLLWEMCLPFFSSTWLRKSWTHPYWCIICIFVCIKLYFYQLLTAAPYMNYKLTNLLFIYLILNISSWKFVIILFFLVSESVVSSDCSDRSLL